MPDRERNGEESRARGARYHAQARRCPLSRGHGHGVHASCRGARRPHLGRGARHARHEQRRFPLVEVVLPRAHPPLPCGDHGRAERERASDERHLRRQGTRALRTRVYPRRAVRAFLPHIVQVVLPGERDADGSALPRGDGSCGLRRHPGRNRCVLRHGNDRPCGGEVGRGARDWRRLGGVGDSRCADERPPQRCRERGVRRRRRY